MPLLGVGILAGHGIDGQTEVEVIDHQGLAREHRLGNVAGFWDPVLRTGQVIAVENLGAVTRQSNGAVRFELPHHFGKALGGGLHQGTADRGLGPFKFLIDCGEGRRNVRRVQIGTANRWLHAADDGSHQLDHGGEEQLAGVLACGGAFKHSVQFGGVEGPLHEEAEEHGHRGVQNESFKHSAEYHDPLPGKRNLQLSPQLISAVLQSLWVTSTARIHRLLWRRATARNLEKKYEITQALWRRPITSNASHLGRGSPQGKPPDRSASAGRLGASPARGRLDPRHPERGFQVGKFFPADSSDGTVR